MTVLSQENSLQKHDMLPYLREAVIFYLLAASAFVVSRYMLEIRHGGQVWTTGDWLLSYRAGFMRRGLTGSMTYGLSDLTGIKALYIAAASQILIFASLISTVLFILSRLRMTVAVAILAISPVFLLMPFYFSKLAMCKEMIGCLAIALVGATAFTPRRWPFWLGIAVFMVSGFAHEINAFLAPDLLALLLILVFSGIVSRGQGMLAGSLVVLSAGAAALTSMLYNGNGLGQAVCDVMLTYGGRPEFCGRQGPTIWLDRDMAYGMRFTWQENVVTGVWPWFFLGFILSMMPFYLFRVVDDRGGRRTRLALLAAVFGIMAFSPLFVIASDWGRWIAMHVFGLTMLTWVSLRLGLLEDRYKKLSPLLLVFGLVWAMPDYGEPLTSGLLQKAGTILSHVVQRFSG